MTLFGSVASNWSWLLGTVPPLRQRRSFAACDFGVCFGKAEYIRKRLQTVPIGNRAKLLCHISQIAGSGLLVFGRHHYLFRHQPMIRAAVLPVKRVLAS